MVSTRLELMEPEFSDKYLKQAYRRFKRGACVRSIDLSLVNGEYKSWFHHGFDYKKHCPTAKLTPDGKYAFKQVFRKR